MLCRIMIKSYYDTHIVCEANYQIIIKSYVKPSYKKIDNITDAIIYYKCYNIVQCYIFDANITIEYLKTLQSVYNIPINVMFDRHMVSVTCDAVTINTFNYTYNDHARIYKNILYTGYNKFQLNPHTCISKILAEYDYLL